MKRGDDDFAGIDAYFDRLESARAAAAARVRTTAAALARARGAQLLPAQRDAERARQTLDLANQELKSALRARAALAVEIPVGGISRANDALKAARAATTTAVATGTGHESRG